MNDPTHAIAEAVKARLRLSGDVERFADGSVPVYAVGKDHVVKLFPATEASLYDAERAALQRLDGGSSLPTPRLWHSGDCEGWLYVTMSRLQGISLAKAWPTIERSEQLRLIRAVGAGLAELHESAAEGLAPLTIDWTHFIANQRACCRERQQAKQLDAAWLDQVDGFLDRHLPPAPSQRALLHTEVMREHLLVEQREGVWHLSGIVDFEPAMVGAPEYDFASVGVFTTCAEPGLLAAFLEGYGKHVDDELPFRIMAYALLHRYSNLRWYQERLGTGDARDLESLARRWFSP